MQGIKQLRIYEDSASGRVENVADGQDSGEAGREAQEASLERCI
ncbi:MAG: hypothetical protein ACLQMT_07275 [Candidatus Acidiferrales bacterium]